VIARVGLTGRESEPVRGFSLGMKQRLGIAMAILPEPELVILDEPTNGLDPAGMVEVRSLLRALGASGRTVVVSSHQLGELETVCDRLVVVRYGDLLFNGLTSELLARGRAAVVVRPEHGDDTPRLRAVLGTSGWKVEAASDGLRVDAAPEEAAAINRAAAAAGITLATLVAHRQSLEEIFLALTADGRDQLGMQRSAA